MTASFAQQLGRIDAKLDRLKSMDAKLDGLVIELQITRKAMINGFDRLEKRFDALDSTFATMNNRLNTLNHILSQLAKTLDRTDA